MNDQRTESAYLRQFRGSFVSALKWPNLDELWARLRDAPEGWYIYAIGEPPPVAPASAPEFLHFLEEIDSLLRREHEHDYCGIVYASDLSAPEMVKIYDPNNLGVSCGFSDKPPLPGWVLSRIPPVDMQPDAVVPANRRRWWQRILNR